MVPAYIDRCVRLSSFNKIFATPAFEASIFTAEKTVLTRFPKAVFTYMSFRFYSAYTVGTKIVFSAPRTFVPCSSGDWLSTEGTVMSYTILFLDIWFGEIKGGPTMTALILIMVSTF